MAKFGKSIFTPDLRGKAGATVFKKNRYGNYMSNRSIPVNNRTEPQQRVRATLGGLSRIWSQNPTEKQYLAWMKLASKITFTDSSGYKYNPAARDIFTSLNFNRSELGLPIIFDPPSKLSVQSFKKFKVEIFPLDNGNDICLSFEPPINKDTRIMIFASNWSKRSIFFFRDSRYKEVGYVDSSFKSGDSILSLYRSLPAYNFKLHGSFKIAFRFKPVSVSTGFSKDLIETTAGCY